MTQNPLLRVAAGRWLQAAISRSPCLKESLTSDARTIVKEMPPMNTNPLSWLVDQYLEPATVRPIWLRDVRDWYMPSATDPYTGDIMTIIRPRTATVSVALQDEIVLVRFSNGDVMLVRTELRFELESRMRTRAGGITEFIAYWNDRESVELSGPLLDYVFRHHTRVMHVATARSMRPRFPELG